MSDTEFGLPRLPNRAEWGRTARAPTRSRASVLVARHRVQPTARRRRRNQLFIMNADGTGITQITGVRLEDEPQGSNLGASWDLLRVKVDQ
jgi:hypothetical protein